MVKFESMVLPRVSGNLDKALKKSGRILALYKDLLNYCAWTLAEIGRLGSF